MNVENTKLIERFVKNARPADRVPYVMQLEIIDLLTEIRDELKADKPKTASRKTVVAK